MQELIRGIGHDVGAPARHIVHFSQMLDEDIEADTLSEKHRRWLELIQNSGRQIQNMLTCLTKLSRLSGRAGEMEKLRKV